MESPITESSNGEMCKKEEVFQYRYQIFGFIHAAMH